MSIPTISSSPIPDLLSEAGTVPRA